MTSKIVVNNIESDAGISSVTLISHVAGHNSTQNISGINSVTANAFYGDGSNLTGAGPTLTNGADNRVVTASSATALNGEANLTFDGSILNINAGVPSLKLTDSDGGPCFHEIKGPGNGDLRISCDVGDSSSSGSEIQFLIHDSTKATIDSSGHLLPGTDNASDLGSSSKRWRNIYSADLQLSNKGSTNNVDGTWGNYTIQEGESDLFLINNRNGKKYKFNLTEVS